jgi:hypothetical protein
MIVFCSKYLNFEIDEVISRYIHKHSPFKVTPDKYQPYVSFHENVTGVQTSLLEKKMLSF